MLIGDDFTKLICDACWRSPRELRAAARVASERRVSLLPRLVSVAQPRRWPARVHSQQSLRRELRSEPSQSRAAPQRLGFSHVFSLSKWRTVLRSLLKNRYRTTYRCYSFSETSSQDAFNAAYGASNRHHGGECDLGEGRHRLVGSTSMRSFSVVPLPPRSLSLHDVAVAREVLASARPTSLHTRRSCRVCVDAAS